MFLWWFFFGLLIIHIISKLTGTFRVIYFTCLSAVYYNLRFLGVAHFHFHLISQGSRDNMSVILVTFPGAPRVSQDAIKQVLHVSTGYLYC